MEKLSRRRFFKSSTLTLLTLPLFGRALGLFNMAYSADVKRDDSATLKAAKQGYVHDGTKDVSDPSHPKHVTKITDFLKEIKKSDSKVNPLCSNCMQFKKEESDGYGECAMVLANGKEDGKFVYKDGWCKVWTISQEKIKKEVGA